MLTNLSLLTVAVSAGFLLLATWHFVMAFSPALGESAAVPTVEGKPLFVPSRKSTLIVAIVLMLFAILVAATGGILVIGVPQKWLAWCSYALALGLFARAIGDFKYVGFFKSVRGSPFAKMDTRVYSPICVLLAAGVAANAILHTV